MNDDAALVAAALAGGPEAFGPIVTRYRDAVFGVALARLRNFHDAEDITQTAFVEAYQRLGNLKDPARLGAWLRSITVHRCIDHLRRRSETVELDEIEDHLNDAATPHTEMERQELRDRIMAAIGRLSRPQAETTVLFYIDGYSQEEVARIQEVPVGTIKRRLHDARIRLKEEMMDVVEDVLKAEAPKEDFGERVFKILFRYHQPAIPWQEWDRIASKLREIGTRGMDGFIKALESPHSPTRAFAVSMLQTSGQTDEVVEELLKKSLTDSSKKVRKISFLALFGIIERDEAKRKRLVPCLLPLLTDRSKLLRQSAAWYLGYLEDFAKYVPLDRVALALANEKDLRVRDEMVMLMRTVLQAQEGKKEKE